MDKKGFTLIELLAVIIIISMLTILVLPKITNSVKNYSNKTDELMLDMIKNAAKLYVEDNASFFEENSYGYYCVSLNELIDKDYLKDGIEISGEDATYTKRLKITYDSDYKIDVVDSDECVILDPGLYDENNLLLATWDELIEKGLDIESDFTSSTSPNPNILNSYGTKYKLIVDGSVTKIGNYALYRCDKLLEIIIPKSVTSIGINAFCANSSLTSITLPDSLINIGTYAFQNCSGLKSIIIPKSVTSIASSIFSGCRKLESIVVDEGNDIYDSRENCNAIIETESNTLIAGCQNTVIPESVTSIGYDSFYGSELKSITIPKNVTSIGYSAFTGCRKLESIVVDEGNDIYDSRENCNAIIETESNTLIAGCQNTVIPESVTSIGYNAFYARNLTSIIIPESITSIGNQSFSSNQLTNIIIPSSVTSIGSSAFAYNYSLTTIAIPSSVTSIGNNAFNGCTNLTTIYYSGTATGSPWGAPSATVVSE